MSKRQRSRTRRILAGLAVVLLPGLLHAQALKLEDDLVIERPGLFLGSAFHFDSSLADLWLGEFGAAGDLFIRDDLLRTTLSFESSSALLTLGAVDQDGDLWVKNSAGATTVDLDGNTGDVKNTFAGNGTVKAWAKIDSDGSVLSCWRCNAAATFRIPCCAGEYIVSFSPLATDIQSRPAGTSSNDRNPRTVSVFTPFPMVGPPSSVHVVSVDQDDNQVDSPFTVFIY